MAGKSPKLLPRLEFLYLKLGQDKSYLELCFQLGFFGGSLMSFKKQEYSTGKKKKKKHKCVPISHPLDFYNTLIQATIRSFSQKIVSESPALIDLFQDLGQGPQIGGRPAWDCLFFQFYSHSVNTSSNKLVKMPDKEQ